MILRWRNGEGIRRGRDMIWKEITETDAFQVRSARLLRFCAKEVTIPIRNSSMRGAPAYARHSLLILCKRMAKLVFYTASRTMANLVILAMTKLWCEKWPSFFNDREDDSERAFRGGRLSFDRAGMRPT